MTAGAVAALLVLTLAAAPSEGQAVRTRLIVIVPSSQTLTDLSVADLRRIYLGEMTRWPDGRRIVPVMLAPNTPSSELFLKRVLLMSPIDFAQQWIGVVFRGRAPAPPLVVKTSADAIRFVATHSDSIAVIGEDAVPGPAMRMATIDHKSVDAADYPLMW